jgi:hypothetical protein
MSRSYRVSANVYPDTTQKADDRPGSIRLLRECSLAIPNATGPQK